MKLLWLGCLVATAAACSSATAPKSNPCSASETQEVAQYTAIYGAPYSVFHHPTVDEYNFAVPGKTASLTFDWSSGSCVVTPWQSAS